MVGGGRQISTADVIPTCSAISCAFTIYANFNVLPLGTQLITIKLYSVPAGHGGGFVNYQTLAVNVGNLPPGFACAGGGTDSSNCGTGTAVETQAVTAGAFLSSMGADLYSPAVGTANTNYAAMLTYLGVSFFREGHNSDAISNLLDLAQLSGTLVVPWLYHDMSGYTTASLQAWLGQTGGGIRDLATAGVLLAIEGPNEADNWCVTYNGATWGGGGNCAAHSWTGLAQMQADAYVAIKIGPGFAGISGLEYIACCDGS